VQRLSVVGVQRRRIAVVEVDDALDIAERIEV
jgi:hypothetical protein